ncbi:MAG: hypothetical protein RIE73_17950 [Coleofasciculus sp. C1-SOL-03]|jgi:hypothetical protein|uniref:hypothetical protein n=1 Tax=Coleofasciculus sp. C1-SOL-03 TaxID=3069522 RepID=UPI0032F40E8C
MKPPKSYNTRPADLETPGDIEQPDTSGEEPNQAATNTPKNQTDADILRERAISDAQARDDLQAKQDDQ